MPFSASHPLDSFKPPFVSEVRRSPCKVSNTKHPPFSFLGCGTSLCLTLNISRSPWSCFHKRRDFEKPIEIDLVWKNRV